MTLIMLMSIGVVVLAAALIVVLKYMKSSDEEDETDYVPISDPKELQQIQKVFSRDEQSGDDQPAQPIAADPAPQETIPDQSDNPSPFASTPIFPETAPPSDPAPASAPHVDSDLLDEKKQIEEEKKALMEEIQNLQKETQTKFEEEAREKERMQAELKHALDEKEQALQKAAHSTDAVELADRLNHAQASIMRLKGENTRLKGLIEEHKAQLSQGVQAQVHDASPGQIIKHDAPFEMEAVQQELMRVQEEADLQKQKDKAAMDKLRQHLTELEKEREQIRDINKELEQKQRDMQVQLKENMKQDQLTDENVVLREKLQKADVQIQNIQESLEVMKMTYEQKIHDAEDELYSLKNGPSARGGSSGKPELDPVALSKVRVEELTKDMEELRQALAETEKTTEQLKEENARLLEKERLMEFEVSKNRAQAYGLEKLCEELRLKMESEV